MNENNQMPDGMSEDDFTAISFPKNQVRCVFCDKLLEGETVKNLCGSNGIALLCCDEHLAETKKMVMIISHTAYNYMGMKKFLSELDKAGQGIPGMPPIMGMPNQVESNSEAETDKKPELPPAVKNLKIHIGKPSLKKTERSLDELN